MDWQPAPAGGRHTLHAPMAARASRQRPNILITGTPGTGKTTTSQLLAVRPRSAPRAVPAAHRGWRARRNDAGSSSCLSANWCELQRPFAGACNCALGVPTSGLALAAQVKQKALHSGHDAEFDTYVIDEDAEDRVRAHVAIAHTLCQSLPP